METRTGCSRSGLLAGTAKPRCCTAAEHPRRRITTSVPQSAVQPVFPGARQRGATIKPNSTPFLAFVKTEESIQVALDAYKVLGISTMASKDSVRKAYERLVMGNPEANLSQDMLCSRAVVLKAAADALMDSSARHIYDQDGLLEILHEDLPGCISLLTESGDWEVGLEWGAAWLARNSNGPLAKDVASCMAMAFCSKAAAQLEAEPENAAAPVASLESGAAILQRHNCDHPELKQNIAQTLQELRPRQVLQQLAAPEEGGNARVESIDVLKNLLWTTDGQAAGKSSRRQLLDAACQHLTAAEQAVLFEGIATNPTGVPDGEIYGAALAFLASGFRSHTPAHLKTAARLLSALDGKVEPATGRKRFDAMDVSIELAACNLLLGDVTGAEAALGLGEAAHRGPDPAVKQFVMEHAEAHSGDTLPGICKLVRQWLEEVAAERFPELQELGVDLDAWFKNPRISLYLQVVDKSRRLGAAAVVQQLQARMAAVMAGLLGAVKALLQLLMSPAQLFGKAPPTARSPANLPQVAGAQQWDENTEEFEDLLDGLPPTSAAATTGRPSVMSAVEEPLPSSRRSVSRQDAEEEREARIAAAEAKAALGRKKEAGVPLSAIADQTVGQLHQIQDAMPLDEHEDGYSTEYMDVPLPMPPPRAGYMTGADVPRLLIMEGERDMWASYRPQRRRLQMALSALTLAAACVGVWLLATRGQLTKAVAADLVASTAKAMVAISPPQALWKALDDLQRKFAGMAARGGAVSY